MQEIIMKIYNLSKVRQGGFTVDLKGNEVEPRGYVVALNETQNSFGYDGLVRVYNVAKEKGIYVGGWFEKDTGLYYFDACVIVETEFEADELARKEKQKAYYDFKENREVIL